jgi:predicted phage-related endonuclease
MGVERHDIKDRESWLAMRRHVINASEVGTLLHANPYSSPATLFAEKKGKRSPRENSEWLRRRRWGEAAVFEALADEMQAWDVTRASVYLVDATRKLGATPDGYAERPDLPGAGIIQAKTVARTIFRQRWLIDPDDSVEHGDAIPPPHYQLQTLTEAMLSDCSWAVLAVLVQSEFDHWLRIFEIDRDPIAEQNIVDAVAAFFTNHLEPNIMPEFDPKQDEALIKSLFPKDVGTTIDLSGDNRARILVNDLTKTQDALHHLKNEEKEIKTELTGKLGEHAYGRIGDGRIVCWQTSKRRGYTVAPGQYRVLKVIKDKLHTEGD